MPSCPWRSFDELLICSPADELLIGGDEQLIKSPGRAPQAEVKVVFVMPLEASRGRPLLAQAVIPWRSIFNPILFPLRVSTPHKFIPDPTNLWVWGGTCNSPRRRHTAR